KKSAKPTLAPQTGRSLTDHVLKMHSETFCVSDLPVRSFKEASRHFLEVASTPPHEEGNMFSISPTSSTATARLLATFYDSFAPSQVCAEPRDAPTALTDLLFLR